MILDCYSRADGEFKADANAHGDSSGMLRVQLTRSGVVLLQARLSQLQAEGQAPRRARPGPFQGERDYSEQGSGGVAPVFWNLGFGLE